MSGSLQEFATTLAARYAPLAGQIGVAVSGGADSVFLLYVLHEAGLAACALHVNHQLRGAESDADEAFVAAIALGLNLPVFVQTLPPPAGNLEQEARRARYTWFGECIAEGRCRVVATGHTLDDQAETVVSRFLRGAGTAGLAAILPGTAAGLIRPLLDLPREAIRTWLRERNITWREDASNLDLAFLRNRIRHEVMPALTAINPSLPATLAATAAWARAEEDYWTAEIDRLAAQKIERRDEIVLLRTSELLELPLAAQRRLLRRAVEMVRGSLRSIDFQHIEGIRRLSESREGSGRLQLPDLDVYRSFDWLRLAPIGFDSRLDRDFETALAIPARTHLPERLLTIETELVRENGVYNSDEYALDLSRCGSPLLLRNWRPGDSLRLQGADRAEKIKTLFQDHRIPLWERRAWPVIVDGRSIVWTRRFGVASEYAAEPGSSQVVLVREVGESKTQSRASTGIEGSGAHGDASHCRGAREGTEVL